MKRTTEKEKKVKDKMGKGRKATKKERKKGRKNEKQKLRNSNKCLKTWRRGSRCKTNQLRIMNMNRFSERTSTEWQNNEIME